MPISDTDLLLNADGSVYHLGLLPQQLAKTILTVGDPERVEAISKHFDLVEHRVEKREFCTHTGFYKGKHLSVVSTGIGTDNVDIVVNELDALVNIDLATRERKETHTQLTIIRVGTSGAIQSNWETGTITFAEFALGLDNLMHFYDYDPSGSLGILGAEAADYFERHTELMVMPYVTAAHPEMLKDRLPKTWLPGVAVTAPGFYGPQGRMLRAKLAEKRLLPILTKVKFGKYSLTNIEMETSGLYGLCHLLGHRALSISVILANRNTDTWHEAPQKAVEQLIEEVLAWLAL